MRRKLNDLSVMSFNLLAPCYFRHGGRLEAGDPQLYMRRLQALVAPLKAEKSHVMCLQEFWFDEEYMRTFQSHFPHFSCYASKRPGMKEDGLAIFIDNNMLAIHNFNQLDFDKSGERVAMLMHLSIHPKFIESLTHSFMERVQSFLFFLPSNTSSFFYLVVFLASECPFDVSPQRHQPRHAHVTNPNHAQGCP
jgi:mRNA deadenylase 3'-5' endonuclease subunit Ccr4